MDRLFFILGAGLALIGVAAGAFGAHGLEDRISEDMVAVFETGVRYQMYHALGLLAAALAYGKWPCAWMRAGGWFFLAGILLFSGSLYLLSISGVRWFGAITPAGGISFLAGWACLAWGAWKTNSSRPAGKPSASLER